MSCSYSPDQFKLWTEKYWDLDVENAKHYYLGPLDRLGEPPPEPLLHLEMACVEEKGRLPTLDNRPITLAILVGDSFQPLLQTIWAYRPRRLVPIINRFYGDRDELSPNHKKGVIQWRKLRQQIRKLPPERQPEIIPGITEEQLVEDTPSDVFSALYHELRDDLAAPDLRVVIDITGAKKTMVAGAFLLAAYTNAEISYVDFDVYHAERGKPYGYTCHIKSVDNPFHEWGLREWERAAQLYTQYDFAGALAVLPDQLPVEAATWQPALDNLRCFLALCNNWENGQLREARTRLSQLPEELHPFVPLAVKELGQYWPEPDSQRTEWISVQFLKNPQAILIYAFDELARSERLICRDGKTRLDHRSAFARAFALHETLIKSRVASVFYRGCFTVRVKANSNMFDSDTIPDELTEAARRWLLYWLRTDHAKQLMETTEENKKGYPWYKTEEDNIPVQIWKKSTSTYPQPLLQIPLEFDQEELQNKRNVIIHNYVPVTETDANQVVTLAKANLDDYCQRWGHWIDEDFDPETTFPETAFTVPDWQRLKNTCGLDFIPDPRTKEVV